MTFPSDQVLIARGKYSTLSRERQAQLKRVQSVCNTMITATQQALRDAEAKPPESVAPLLTLEKCLDNLKDARAKLVDLCDQMIELHPLAWDAENEE